MVYGDDDARFAQYVLPLPNGCHEWTGGRDDDGYGQFRSGKQDGQRTVRAVRWLWERRRGPIPTGLVLDHFRCSWPPCVNLNHVRPVTQRENLLRSDVNGAALNRAKTRCKWGHEFTDENTRIARDGSRFCRKCWAIRMRNYRAGRGKVIRPADVTESAT